MASPNPVAAGAPLALALVAGAIVGGYYDQPTIGLLAGLVVGVAVAVTVWLRDKGKIGH